MVTVVLVVIAVVCAVGWLTSFISNAMLLWYIDKKGIPFPSEEEMEEGTRWAVSNMIKDLISWRGQERR